MCWALWEALEIQKGRGLDHTEGGWHEERQAGLQTATEQIKSSKCYESNVDCGLRLGERDPGRLLGGEGLFSPLGLAHPERHREGQTGAEMRLQGQRDSSPGVSG